MPTAHRDDWRKEFGVAGTPSFFSKQDIDAAGGTVPQPQALRRAFEQLQLDGVLCQENAPLIYFRELETIEPAMVAGLQRIFWNQGVAPILVLITRDEVQVYSGLAQPSREPTAGPHASGLVETLQRVTTELKGFILSVESGEYFRAHRKSFDPRHRVDRTLLRNLQETRARLEVPTARLAPQVLDALLCRLVFTCYLFDRGVIDGAYLETIGIRDAGHLRDILAQKPRAHAKAQLYALFEQLGRDFNGDLFSDDLKAESRGVKDEHLDIIDQFFRSAELRSGQGSLWPYDFGVIPIETISAIYEQFLKLADEKEKKKTGTFFTPRFLAEVVLDLTLDGSSSLLKKRFLDPACGSGIFLVGLFNRLAEAWKRDNPAARYERTAAGLMRVLTESLYGIDRNATACRITAFSLYLAFLDQLSPPDIRQLRLKGKVLPRLVRVREGERTHGGTILCADFFTDEADLPCKVDIVVGNPPWASVSERKASAAIWVTERTLPFPDRQLASAFVWKAPEHLNPGGRVCFVLPHGTLFNHNAPALEFQRTWLQRHAVDVVLNLVDYQRFLFEESEAPALVVRYAKERPADSSHRIDYWAPKTDWAASQAEIISLQPADRARLTVREVLDDLKHEDAPLIWKERSWATPRDRRLLDRLALMPKLGDLAGQPSHGPKKRWVIAEGFQPLGKNDDPKTSKVLILPTKLFIEARSSDLSLFLLESDCTKLPKQSVEVRRGRSDRNNLVFRAPHVLVNQGFSRSAFADFDVAFRHAVRGVHGPKEDRALLMFLAAYLRSALARYFFFHTSSNWGVSRAKVHVNELLRLPFFTPEQSDDPRRSREIVRGVAETVTAAATLAKAQLADRNEIVSRAVATAERLVEEYFDLDEIERMLVADTDEIIIPSARPTRDRPDIPTLRPSTQRDRDTYTTLLCKRLNSWASEKYQVHAVPAASAKLGVGLVVLEKTLRGAPSLLVNDPDLDVLSTFHRLRRVAAKGTSTLELSRGVKVFDRTLLYMTKPLGRRHWTRTAALNDADDIAGTILMRPSRGCT